jgi:hypothetical protein
MLKLAAAALVALTSTAVAAPPKGAFKLTTMVEGKQTTVLADEYKKGGMRGEVVFEFDGNKLSVGVWTMNKDTMRGVKNPIVTTCRASIVLPVKWTGDALKLPMPVELSGSANTSITEWKGADSETDDTATNCGFRFGDVDYKVTASGDKLTLTGPKLTFNFVRGVAIAKTEVAVMAGEFSK